MIAGGTVPGDPNTRLVALVTPTVLRIEPGPRPKAKARKAAAAAAQAENVEAF